MELNGPEAKAAFMEKVRRRLTFGMDPGAGSHSHATAFAWAWGYEQALADLDATTAVFEKAFASEPEPVYSEPSEVKAPAPTDPPEGPKECPTCGSTKDGHYCEP